MNNEQKGTYLITTGIVGLFENRYGLNLSENAKTNIAQQEQNFLSVLKSLLEKDYDFRVVSNTEIENRVKKGVEKSNGYPLITLDDCLFKDIPTGGNISVTRLIDPTNFKNRVIGPRKGYPAVEDQLDTIASKYAKVGIGIIDVGAFEGETLVGPDGLVKKLEAREVYVKKFYGGIVNQPAYDNLRKQGIEVILGGPIDDFDKGDWLESRDLLGLDGKKIKRDGLNVDEDTHLFLRYIKDYDTLNDNASIKNKFTAQGVISLSNTYRERIFDELRIEGYEIQESFLNNDDRFYKLKFNKLEGVEKDDLYNKVNNRLSAQDRIDRARFDDDMPL